MKHLTPAMKRRIAKLTPTTSQHDIAGLLGIHRNTVYATQKKLGLTARPPRPSTRAILDLVDSGLSHAKAAKALNTEAHIVRYVCEKNGRKPGRHRPKPISEEKMGKIMADICSGLYCGTEISRRNNFDYKKTMKLIHEVRQCERFIGNTKTPLDSYFPQKWPDSPLGKKSDNASRKMDTGPNFLTLVTFLMARLKNEMPDDIAQGARLLTGLCFRFVPRQTVDSLTPGQQDQAIEYFQAHMLSAMMALRESENARWKN